MRILFLSDDFPPKSFGGAGIITYNLAKAIVKAGHEMFVITTVQDKAVPRGWKNLDGMKVYDLYNDYDGRFAAYVSLYNPGTLGVIEKIIQEVKPDVIHAHNIHNNISYHALKIARKYTDKVFLTTHDAMAFNYGKLVNYYDKNDLSVHTQFSYKVGFLQNLKTAKKRYNPFRNLAIRYYLNTYPKKIFSITDKVKDALSQNGIKNVTTIHYGIELEDQYVSPEETHIYAKKLGLLGKKVVFFGGRLSEAKGGKVMVDALQVLVNSDTSVSMLIAGTPNGYADYLLQYATQLGVRDHIVFTGWLSQDDMRKAYAVCNVVATPSLYFDAFNIFNMEAGAAGKPVVGTCFGGTPEIVLDGQTGIIVNPRNIEMLASALKKLLDDPEYTHKLGMMGRKRMENFFTMERFVQDSLDWYLK